MAYRDEIRHSIRGVSGSLHAAHIWPEGVGRSAGLFRSQTWTSEKRRFPEYDYSGKLAYIRAEIRFDDNCRNGKHSFAMTGEIRVGGTVEACGCLHDDIAKAFPELAPLAQWHLCNSTGPMHYESNTVYHASDRDCHGKRVGEPWSFSDAVQFGANPIKHPLTSKFAQWLKNNRASHGPDFDFQVLPIEHAGTDGKREFAAHYTFGGFGDKWHDCPFRTESEAQDFLKALQTCDPEFLSIPTAWSEGKARNLDAARNAAIWPDATDEELTREPDELRAALQARLPALLQAFRETIADIGLEWEPRA